MLYYGCVHRCETNTTGSAAHLVQPIVQAHNRVVVWHCCTHRLHLHRRIILSRHRSGHGHDAYPRTQTGGRWWRCTAPGAAWRSGRRHCLCPCQSPSASPPARTGNTCRRARPALHHSAMCGTAVSDTRCRHNTCDAYRRSQALGASGMASDSCQICSERHTIGALSSYSIPMLCKAKDHDHVREASVVSCAAFQHRCTMIAHRIGDVPHHLKLREVHLGTERTTWSGSRVQACIADAARRKRHLHTPDPLARCCS